MPGRLTTPTTDIWLRIGVMPARTAVRAALRAASQRVPPSARMVSTWSRVATSSPVMRSSASPTPVSVLPRIMPMIGIAYCGVYHGRACSTTTSPMAPISQVLPNTDSVPSRRSPA